MTEGRAAEMVPAGDGASVPTPAALLARLIGTWTIERSISPDGSFRGAATFVQRADGDLGYSEQGELVLPTGRFAAERRYRFEPHETGFTVHFVDTAPRLFHRVELRRMPDGAWTGEAPHPCGNDLYVTAYCFAPDGTFTIINRVSGPNKDYVVTSAYTRTGSQRIAA
ncbi:DUF6314 family protein [Terrihabitans rhizophilus]|uniref:DUF6314 family protein n=1 Tax=Terrihabitans rhizophilus TaxID=3092662 RepID=A0ABU4RLG5_9HYPH|nr:DUF6314 family protein [Terrihabitans sp. PJ23]MDX6805669.1 DUF6314 family protein [Terrihabitans sp. PJ23]